MSNVSGSYSHTEGERTHFIRRYGIPTSSTALEKTSKPSTGRRMTAFTARQTCHKHARGQYEGSQHQRKESERTGAR